MPGIWTWMLFRLGLALVGGALIGLIYDRPALGMLIVALGALGWQLYNLYRLERWLNTGSIADIPDGDGVWPPVFARIQFIKTKAKRRGKRFRRLVKELRDFDLDFVIGSVHDIDDEPILERAYAPQFFQSRPIDAWIEKYFKKAEEIADSGLFNVLAHLDVYKRYGRAVYGDALRDAHKPFLSRLFEKMKANDLALEINTSGVRHGMGEYYPSMDILNEARRAEVFVAGLGSDAHAPDQLALDFESAIALAPELLPSGLEEGYDL